MKLQAIVSFLTFGTAAIFINVASGATTDTSKISEFAGRYSGTVIISSFGSSAAGTAQGSFRTSKKKENGNLAIDSVVGNGGIPLTLQERYSFHNRSFVYTLNSSGTGASGIGRARIGKKTISYQAFISSGGSSINVQGTIRRTAKRLVVNEVLSSSGFSTSIVYSLKRHGK